MKFCDSCLDKCSMDCDKRIILMFEVMPNSITDTEWKICFNESESDHAKDLYEYVNTHEKFRGFSIIPFTSILMYPYKEVK